MKKVQHRLLGSRGGQSFWQALLMFCSFLYVFICHGSQEYFSKLTLWEDTDIAPDSAFYFLILPGETGIP